MIVLDVLVDEVPLHEFVILRLFSSTEQLSTFDVVQEIRDVSTESKNDGVAVMDNI